MKFSQLTYTFLALLLTCSISSFGQCGNQLVDSLLAENDENEIYIREFKVRFNEGTLDNPTPTKKYSVYLNEGIQYHFAVRNADEFDGDVIMQLFDRNNLIGSTFDLSKQIDRQQFNFMCDRAGRYQLLMSFKEGKAGCAAGIMTMRVQEDSAASAEQLAELADSTEALYVNVKNYIQAASEIYHENRYEITISHGLIQKTEKGYCIEVTEIKPLELYVKLKDENGILSETDTLHFRVENEPLPLARLLGKEGGILYKHEIWRIQQLQLDYQYEFLTKDAPYTILSFMVNSQPAEYGGYPSNGAQFSARQLQFIQSLNEGNTFYINNIRARGPGNKTYTLPPLGFIIN